MRAWLSIIVIAATMPAAQAGIWTAACMDQQVEYQQIVGAEGYVHAAIGDGSYTTVKLKQSFLNNTMICGSVNAKVAGGEIATVCADSETQTIKVIKGAQLAKGMKPEDAPVYCSAVVNVN